MAYGLDHVVIGTHLQAAHLIQLLAPGGQHEHWHIGGAADLLQDLEATLAGQGHVEYHDVGDVLVEGVQPGLAIAGDQHRGVLPLQLEAHGESVEDRLVVVHHQDGQSRPSCGPPAPWPVGSAIQNVAPAPGVLSSHRRPPCSSTRARTIGRPRPLPWLRRVASVSER